MITAGVLQLNADLLPLAFIDWQRAVGLLLSTDKNGVPMATMFESDPDRLVRSPSITIKHPRIIQMTRWYYVPANRRNSMNLDDLASNRQIMARDKYRCCYCDNEASTVDHVFPKSRGGGNTWDNLVAACKKCNSKKANRTPEEAGMKMLWHPWRPDITGYTQRKIWAMDSESGLTV